MAIIPEQSGATLAARVTNVDGRASALESHTSGWVNVRSYGAVGDGSTNDAPAIQAALNAAQGRAVRLPRSSGDYIITSPLDIPDGTTLIGEGHFYATRITAVGCDGLRIAAGAENVHIENIEVALAVPYLNKTTAAIQPNTNIGILVQGAGGDLPKNHLYRNVYVDGFHTGFRVEFLWTSVFENVRTEWGAVGFHAVGLSVNNTIANSQFTGPNRYAGSKGIYLDGVTAGPSEGWMISNTLVISFENGVHGAGYTHVFLSNSIIDHTGACGVLIEDDGATNFGGNWTIIGNYIAMTGASGDAAIKSTNSKSNVQNRGNHIAHNQILAYEGQTCAHGIWMAGSEAKHNVIVGNSLKNFTDYDIRALQEGAGGDVLSGNSAMSSITTNIVGGAVVFGNVGTVYYERSKQYLSLGPNKIAWDEAAPTSGTWVQGDVVWKVNPSAGGEPGWVCTAGGTPGTWKAMGNLAS